MIPKPTRKKGGTLNMILKTTIDNRTSLQTFRESDYDQKMILPPFQNPNLQHLWHLDTVRSDLLASTIFQCLILVFPTSHYMSPYKRNKKKTVSYQIDSTYCMNNNSRITLSWNNMGDNIVANSIEL